MDFICVAQTRIDWDLLLPGAHKASGRSMSASLDAKGFPCEGHPAFVACVAEFSRKDSDPVSSLRDDRLSLRHSHFCFLMWVDRDILFPLSVLGLSVTAAPEGGALVSATLQSWYHAVVGMLKPTSDWRLRTLGCQLLTWFERESLGEVWGNLQKVSAGDQTFFLMEKP